MDLGFVRSGFRPVWANDIDPEAVATYNRNHELTASGHQAVAGDIQNLDLPPEGSADLVIGGPPCQGFSVAGRMDPDDPRSQHVWNFLSAVKRIQPQAFVMENVKALALNNRWAPLRRALAGTAQDLGYNVRLILLNAADFGVPQARERMFLIGTRGSGQLQIQPPSGLAPITVRDALAALAPFGTPGNDTACTAKITPAKTPVMRRSPFAGMLFNGQGRPLDLERPSLTLPASMGGNRTPIVDQACIDDPTSTPWVVEYHARLLAGKAPLRRVPSRLRRITVEEAAALQTFPSGIEWAGKQSTQYRQIGNAVPPTLAEAVARAIGIALDGTYNDRTYDPSAVIDLTPSLQLRAA